MYKKRKLLMMIVCVMTLAILSTSSFAAPNRLKKDEVETILSDARAAANLTGSKGTFGLGPNTDLFYVRGQYSKEKNKAVDDKERELFKAYNDRDKSTDRGTRVNEEISAMARELERLIQPLLDSKVEENNKITLKFVDNLGNPLPINNVAHVGDDGSYGLYPGLTEIRKYAPSGEVVDYVPVNVYDAMGYVRELELVPLTFTDEPQTINIVFSPTELKALILQAEEKIANVDEEPGNGDLGYLPGEYVSGSKMNLQQAIYYTRAYVSYLEPYEPTWALNKMREALAIFDANQITDENKITIKQVSGETGETLNSMIVYGLPTWTYNIGIKLPNIPNYSAYADIEYKKKYPFSKYMPIYSYLQIRFSDVPKEYHVMYRESMADPLADSEKTEWRTVALQNILQYYADDNIPWKVNTAYDYDDATFSSSDNAERDEHLDFLNILGNALKDEDQWLINYDYVDEYYNDLINDVTNPVTTYDELVEMLKSYTNEARSIDSLKGKITTETVTVEGGSETSKIVNNFKLTWSNVKRATGYEVRYRDIGSTGDGVALREDISANQDEIAYTVNDIYGTNKHLLDKEFIVVAKFDDGVRIISNYVIPRKLVFNSLKVASFTDGNFNMSWQTPDQYSGEELLKTGLKISSYTMKFTDMAEKFDNDTAVDVSSFIPEVQPEYNKVHFLEIAGVSIDGVNLNYFKKFFKVKVVVDGVDYLSNTVYSGEAPDLSAEKGKNSYKFVWPKVDNADAYKVYYSKKNDSGTYEDYVVYIPNNGEDKVPDSAELWLNGEATSFILDDITGEENAIYDHSKFKIAAVFDGFEIESNEIEVNSDLKVPSISGNYSSDLDGYLITWSPIEGMTEQEFFYRDGRDIQIGGESEVPNQGGISLNADGKYQYLVQDVENSVLNEKYVRLVVHVGKVKLYSNSVFVNNPVIQGGNLNIKQGYFEDGAIKLRVGSRFDAVYDFKVFKEMYKPYYKLRLSGTKYLNFDKLTIEMMDITNDTPVKIPVKFMIEENVDTGQTIIYVHLIERTVGDKTFADKFEVGHDYRLVVTSIIDVTDIAEERKKVYDALEVYLNSIGEKYETWKLPYFITNVEIDNEKIDKDMHIKYDASWNSTDSQSSNDQRETSKELFNYEVNMKDKNQLPSSL